MVSLQKMHKIKKCARSLFNIMHTHQELLSQGYVITPTVAWFPLSSVLLSFWENKFIASISKFYFGLEIVLLLSW